MSVYEICDTTDDEIYYPLGIFESLDKAVAAIDLADTKNIKLSDRAEGTETITIYKRDFGWTELGTEVLIRHREEYWDGDDESCWRNVAS